MLFHAGLWVVLDSFHAINSTLKSFSYSDVAILIILTNLFHNNFSFSDTNLKLT